MRRKKAVHFPSSCGNFPALAPTWLKLPESSDAQALWEPRENKALSISPHILGSLGTSKPHIGGMVMPGYLEFSTAENGLNDGPSSVLQPVLSDGSILARFLPQY
jgi:hypothetical protein